MHQNKKTLTPNQAVDLAAKKFRIHISPVTVRLWCTRHNLGYQMKTGKSSRFGRYRVYEDKFVRYLSGKEKNTDQNNPAAPHETIQPAATDEAGGGNM